MLAADTNVLVRLLVRDSPDQVTAAETAIAEGIWVSHLVLAECLCVLSALYKFDPGRIIQTVEILLNHREVVLQEPNVVSAALAQFRLKPRLGFSDCMTLEIARQHGHLPLITFDKDLSKLPGAQKL
jgi:predicted nucleic-acid-binding protein